MVLHTMFPKLHDQDMKTDGTRRNATDVVMPTGGDIESRREVDEDLMGKDLFQSRLPFQVFLASSLRSSNLAF